MNNRTNEPSASPVGDYSKPEPAPRNPLTRAKHSRETFWQIVFPFLLLLLVILALTVGVSWSAVLGSAEVSRWADVALIWQLPLPIFLSFMCLVVNIGLVYGLIKLIGVLPGFTYKIHNYVLIVQNKVNEISDRIVEPVLRWSSFQAKIQSGLRSIRRK